MSRYFDLRSKALAIECASGSPSTARDCDNQEVNPPEDDPLVITKLVLTVTAPYSTYGRCNVCVSLSTTTLTLHAAWSNVADAIITPVCWMGRMHAGEWH